MAVPPTVTALMPAYDAEAFIAEAIGSALAQDYPPERLDVVVVDDGSTDGTAAIVGALAEAHPGRVQLISQENRGLVGAVNAAAAAATGELLALLDADDAWPADKTARQVELLRRRPEVGLVYTDMCVVDADGAVLQESWIGGAPAPTGRRIGPLLQENVVTASGVMVRAALRPALFPIPAELAWADWWLAVRTAQVAEIAYLPEPRTRYRFHGDNMSLGSAGPRRLRELRSALGLQRYFLRRLEAPATSTEDLELAWEGFERMAAEALAEAGSPFAELVQISDADRAQAPALVADAVELLARDSVPDALAAAVRAAATDPSSDATRAAVLTTRARLRDGVGARPLEAARAIVLAIDAATVLVDPSPLRVYAEHAAALPDVTLAIDASSLDAAEAVEAIQAAVVAAGLADDDRADIVLVTGPLDPLGAARLAAGVHEPLTEEALAALLSRDR
jgi:hypothetical protein